MAGVSELILLVLSLGTLTSWQSGERLEIADDFESDTEPEYDSKSLYDLMAHFPLDEDITCPGSDSRFRYPGECSRYVTCRNYQAHIRSCPPGMSFDQNYRHCRLAFEVDCEEDSKTPETCGEDEVYSDCGCERTCGSSNEDDDCADTCEKGCFCRNGYVRDVMGYCVTEDVCHNENSIFSVIGSL